MSEITENVYKKVKDAWNNQADEHNQWDNLGEDEKVAFASVLFGAILKAGEGA